MEYNLFDRELARVEYVTLYQNVNTIVDLVILKNPNDVNRVNQWKCMLSKIYWLKSLAEDTEKKMNVALSQNSSLQIALMKLHLENEELKKDSQEYNVGMDEYRQMNEDIERLKKENNELKKLL